MRQLKKFIINFAISGTSAAFAKTLIAPADRIKLILQNQDLAMQVLKKERATYKGIYDVLVRMPKEQGILSFWRGNGTNILRYIPTQALNFSFNDMYKHIFSITLPSEGWMWNVLPKFAAGGLAGASTTCIVYPLDFCQTKLSTDIGTDKFHLASTKVEREHSNLTHCLSTVYRVDGMRGYYGGLKMAIFGIGVYRGLYFGIFDLNKRLYLGDPDSQFDDQPNIPFHISFIMAQCAGLTSGTISYPFDTVMRRMMIDSGRTSQYKTNMHMLDVIKHIYRKEKLRGFFKGALANCVRCTGGSIVLVLYDQILHYTNWKKMLKDSEMKKLKKTEK